MSTRIARLLSITVIATGLVVVGFFATHLCASGGSDGQIITVDGDGMAPTLMDGDSFRARPVRDVDRFDLVLYRDPLSDEERLLVGRVVGVPGDTLEISGGLLRIDDSRVEEPYAQWNPQDNFGPISIGTNEYVVLGDNRYASLDSRVWGPLPSDQIVGIVSLIEN